MSSPGLASASAPPVSPPLPAAVLWDMDGTLVDTEGYWMDAETALVESFGGTWTHEQALTLVGSGLDRSGEILQDAGVRMAVPDIVAHLTRVVSERLATDGNPFRPGAVELLRALRAQGVRTALVTMSLRDMALTVAGQMGSMRSTSSSRATTSRARSRSPIPTSRRARRSASTRPTRLRSRILRPACARRHPPG